MVHTVRRTWYETAVSDKFARYLPDCIQQWNGPNVRLANGQIISPKQGIEIEIGIHNGKAKGVAVVMPLINTDVLLGNDFLRQLGSVKISYESGKNPNTEQAGLKPTKWFNLKVINEEPSKGWVL